MYRLPAVIHWINLQVYVNVIFTVSFPLGFISASFVPNAGYRAVEQL
jgi:hypothetical protein